MIPHSEFNTGILQILCVKAIIHNGVIENRVCVSLYDSGLLVALLAGVWKHIALGGESTQHEALNIYQELYHSQDFPTFPTGEKQGQFSPTLLPVLHKGFSVWRHSLVSLRAEQEAQPLWEAQPRAGAAPCSGTHHFTKESTPDGRNCSRSLTSLTQMWTSPEGGFLGPAVYEKRKAVMAARATAQNDRAPLLWDPHSSCVLTAPPWASQHCSQLLTQPASAVSDRKRDGTAEPKQPRACPTVTWVLCCFISIGILPHHSTLQCPHAHKLEVVEPFLSPQWIQMWKSDAGCRQCCQTLPLCWSPRSCSDEIAL